MDRRRKLEALAEKRRKTQDESEPAASPSRTKPKPNRIPTSKPRRPQPTSTPHSKPHKPTPSPPPPTRRGRPTRLNEDEYDLDDGFLVDDDESATEEDSDDVSESFLLSDPEEAPVRRHTLKKRQPSKPTAKKPKRRTKRKDSDVENSNDDDEAEDDLSVIDKSNIIEPNEGRGGRRRVTRGNRINYQQFGPDPDDDDS
ncbi:hypothetical protein IWQ61_004523 [Dispira simplex]|nr:hypothetical protein IWQ61_004523 [Dispira simplex]